MVCSAAFCCRAATTDCAKLATQVDESEAVPDYMLPLLALQHVEMEDRDLALNQGGRNPMFQMPAGFVRRMGGAASDTPRRAPPRSRRPGSCEAARHRPSSTRLPQRERCGWSFYILA